MASKFQAVDRDFAFIVDKGIGANELIKEVQKCDPLLITNINIFDIYEGENIEQGKKSIAFSIKLQSMEKTLDEKTIEETCQKIVSAVQSHVGGTLRSS
jgi:phenylalanyl-tRNA synthetase beta chain